MTISVINPITPAMNRTGVVLFRPFDFTKWLGLGFCAFLASLGEGGGSSSSGNSSGNSGSGGPGGGIDKNQIFDFLREYAVIIAIVVVVVVVIGVGLGMLFQWLSSRGKFMFLDGVVNNRGNVVYPWGEYRVEGNSLFFFRFVLGLCGFVLIVLLLGSCLLMAWPSIRSETFGPLAVAAIGLGVTGFVVLTLIMATIGVIIEDFIVPVMYHRRVRVMEAWRIFRYDIAAGHVGAIVLYFLFKILIGLIVGVIALLAVCLTCCLAALPYVGSVVLLPLSVFVRCYSVYFLAQFGPNWNLIPDINGPLKPDGKLVM